MMQHVHTVLGGPPRQRGRSWREGLVIRDYGRFLSAGRGASRL